LRRSLVVDAPGDDFGRDVAHLAVGVLRLSADRTPVMDA
jgi:hypothetical protein